MSKGHATFRQSDLTRALKAARAVGGAGSRVEIEPASGKMIVILGDATERVTAETAANEWGE